MPDEPAPPRGILRFHRLSKPGMEWVDSRFYSAEVMKLQLGLMERTGSYETKAWVEYIKEDLPAPLANR